MEKRAVIIDTFSEGNFHEVVNVSYLIMIASNYDKVTYIANKSSIECIENSLDNLNFANKNIVFKKSNFIKFKQRNGYFVIINWFILGFYNMWDYISNFRKADVFYNLNPGFSIFPIHLIAGFTNKKTFILCHNELEDIIAEKPKRIIKISQLYLKFIFQTINIRKNIHFILLGDNMQNFFRQQIASFNRQQIHSIDHPYIRPVVKFCQENLLNDKKYKVGFPSLINSNRGLANLVFFMEKFHSKQLNLYAISAVLGKLPDCDNFIMLNKTRKLMDFNKYTDYVSQMDCLLFIYGLGSYKLTASGAVLEAIWNLKPIIALKNEYFSYLFDKYGDMGVLCNSIEEMIENLNDFEAFYSRKEFYLQNMKNAKECLLPQNQSKNFAKILEEVL